jgi:hypothetical protein
MCHNQQITPLLSLGNLSNSNLSIIDLNHLSVRFIWVFLELQSITKPNVSSKVTLFIKGTMSKLPKGRLVFEDSIYSYIA